MFARSNGTGAALKPSLEKFDYATTLPRDVSRDLENSDPDAKWMLTIPEDKIHGSTVVVGVRELSRF